MSKLSKKEKIHLSDGWVPSSLVRHILAPRHRKYELYAPMKMQTEVGRSIFPVCQGFNLKNIAWVQNCPDVAISNSLFGLRLFVFLSFYLFSFLYFCLFIFLSFCLFAFLPFCLFVFFTFSFFVFSSSFCLFVFLFFCLDITLIKSLQGLKTQKLLFVSKF